MPKSSRSRRSLAPRPFLFFRRRLRREEEEEEEDGGHTHTHTQREVRVRGVSANNEKKTRRIGVMLIYNRAQFITR